MVPFDIIQGDNHLSNILPVLNMNKTDRAGKNCFIKNLLSYGNANFLAKKSKNVVVRLSKIRSNKVTTSVSNLLNYSNLGKIIQVGPNFWILKIRKKQVLTSFLGNFKRLLGILGPELLGRKTL